jgi:Staphylococcal nuclease homologue
MCSCLGRQVAFPFEYPKGAETGVSRRARDMIEAADRDRYGRIVADVRPPDRRSPNREMARAGLAGWDRRYARDDRARARLEAEARVGRRGRMGGPAPGAAMGVAAASHIEAPMSPSGVWRGPIRRP